MDVSDFATSVAQGLNIEPPHVADVVGWDRLAGGAARLAKELGIQLEGCEYGQPCETHPDDFLIRSAPSVWGDHLRVRTFSCGCQTYPQYGGADRHAPSGSR